MEIEMKARVDNEQVSKLMKFFNKETEYLEKSDEYFSFGGIAPKKPKNIIRIRKEKGAANAPILVFPFLKFFGSSSITVENILTGYIRPFEKTELAKDKTWLTVKAKNTSPDGIETNEETEGQLSIEAENAFRKSMSIANFKPYFTKFKRSFSFYVKNKEDDFEMHAELVTVNGIGPYLEIESIIELENENFDVLDGEHLLKVNTARDQIKWFFKHELGITEFDGRSWADIIEEADSK
jgi:adenylate cyclase class IV